MSRTKNNAVATQVKPVASNTAAAASRGLQKARAWAAPQVERTGQVIQVTVAPALTVMRWGANANWSISTSACAAAAGAGCAATARGAPRRITASAMAMRIALMVRMTDRSL